MAEDDGVPSLSRSSGVCGCRLRLTLSLPEKVQIVWSNWWGRSGFCSVPEEGGHLIGGINNPKTS